jgi:hypothetical protein
MADPSIVPGDRVVDLAASLRFAALVSGGISCAVSLWIIKQSVYWSAAALVVGAIAGLCIGLVLGPLIIPAVAGNVVVVRVGSESLAATLKAGLIGAVIAGAIAAAVPAGIFAQTSKLLLLTGVGCATGVVTGAVLGYLASK